MAISTARTSASTAASAWPRADMPKPESWRLNPARYPVKIELQTRFQDMDINGHLNNVVFAAMSEIGRVLPQIGRASCRERVCQYVEISVCAGSLQKKT